MAYSLRVMVGNKGITLVIGDGAYIGMNSSIIACNSDGIVIGKNAVVGACSLVNKSVADNSIVVGVPAKEIGKVQ